MKQMDDMLNKKSGVFGISGVSSDFRDIEDAAAAGNERAVLALEVFDDRVKQYIAAYAAAMDGVDAILFTAGLGENSIDNRKNICANMDWMGVELSEELNKVRGKEAVVSSENSKVKILVVPTNEELMIARDTLALTK